MFVPEAYITATRQFVAQANNWSLEELALEVTFSKSGCQLNVESDFANIDGFALLSFVIR